MIGPPHSSGAVGSILFDEKIGGTVHLALGQSYAETGGTNESALHWDLVNTEDKTVTALLKGGGSVVIYAGGEFKL